MDRHAINQALAKCIAYQQCGKADEAKQWFELLADLLGYNTGPRPDYRTERRPSAVSRMVF